MGKNRNPSDQSTEQPAPAELDEQNRSAQEQDSLAPGQPPDSENTTTQPWIRNKI